MTRVPAASGPRYRRRDTIRGETHDRQDFRCSARRCGSGASALGQAQDAGGCEALRNTVFDAGFVTTARVVPAADDVPAYCEVRAMALPEIQIEVRLPMDGWNGKLYQTGCGGLCGVLGRDEAGTGFVNNMVPGLRRGYATATSDSGHVGTSIVDAAWPTATPKASATGVGARSARRTGSRPR